MADANGKSSDRPSPPQPPPLPLPPPSSSSSEEKEKRKAARLAMMELSNMISVPMSLQAVIRLGVPDAIYQSGLNAPISAAAILRRLRPSCPPSSAAAAAASASASASASNNLQRLLRMLSSHGVFHEHLSDGGERKYNLTEIGKTLVAEDGKQQLSYAAYVLQHHQEALMRAWPRLHEAVVDPTVEPFASANGGIPAYDYYGKDHDANALMQKAMWGVSVPFMEALLDYYEEVGDPNGGEGGKGLFDGVETLVDVGGSSGACLGMIMNRVSGVKAGVNFDLPEVVAEAHGFPGVTHVGGDMFKSIPAGDAIFIKWVLATWGDEECGVILRNCYDALPEGGRVIACEPVVPEETDDSQRTRALLEGDVFLMAIYRPQGRERTEQEFRRLALSAGFPYFRPIYLLDHFFTVMELRK